MTGLRAVDYAKQILCSQEQLVTDMYGEFVLTEEEYSHWTELLAIQQESEDLLFETERRPGQAGTG